MNAVIVVTMMIVIGAAIGGVTNSLAIKMLFRPYQAVFVGKWRVPFTPGLIPKRRDELAEQLGKMVVTHLLTAEGIQKKITDGKFTAEMTDFVQQEVKSLLQSNLSAADILAQHFKVMDPQRLLLEKTDHFIENKYDSLINGIREKPLGEILPDKLLEKAELALPKLVDIILEKGAAYFQSREGKERLSILIDRFLYGKGTLGNMISMFLGNDRLVDKVQPEIIKFLQDLGTKELILTILTKEFTNLKEKKADVFLMHVEKEDIVPIIQGFIKNQISLFSVLDKPLSTWTSRYEEMILKKWIPKGMELLALQLAKRIEPMMKRLDLEDIVRGQVETFSVSRLEDLVLSISRKEFKMITYLGALLGGIIGFIQGMLVLFIR